jgi:hypothetical protein
MTNAHRKHVVLPPQTVTFLEEYQNRHHLGSFSATIEAAAQALRQQELQREYQQYAHDYAQDAQEQKSADAWLGFPMEETTPDAP